MNQCNSTVFASIVPSVSSNQHLTSIFRFFLHLAHHLPPLTLRRKPEASETSTATH
ncbi:hypothetical protein HanRHA438_Chr04g0167641 [Helianthus annuus]|uniref:Uncharacterized protein n=1 Tax=Helianthus annuus TaxID=4232 RepID=A0A251UVG9_HELAN|nr:hypothetical protein HanXRQr2_Chr04g0157481 [Helianthus annuus]KAJ0588032.1 hypothetical protein HanIR_Chr04g0169951 [Helianthus annuus]KAJ0926140.1 hypothetical protein HanRHA438_Chr04g0167641 [Helianthus annuus]KAJ0930634.1 hypothetical protein HanPSC8_Chr04g0151641 [Helianthus annuus]